VYAGLERKGMAGNTALAVFLLKPPLPLTSVIHGILDNFLRN